MVAVRDFPRSLAHHLRLDPRVAAQLSSSLEYFCEQLSLQHSVSSNPEQLCQLTLLLLCGLRNDRQSLLPLSATNGYIPVLLPKDRRFVHLRQIQLRNPQDLAWINFDSGCALRCDNQTPTRFGSSMSLLQIESVPKHIRDYFHDYFEHGCAFDPNLRLHQYSRLGVSKFISLLHHLGLGQQRRTLAEHKFLHTTLVSEPLEHDLISLVHHTLHASGSGVVHLSGREVRLLLRIQDSI